MPFCPGCGQSVVEFDEHSAIGIGRQSTDTEVANDTSTAAAGTSRSPSVDDGENDLRSDGPLPNATRDASDRGFRFPLIVIVALVVVFGLIALGLPRLLLPGGPTSGGQAAPGSGSRAAPGGSSGGPAPLIVGLTILSPTDGQLVASKEVTVIGTAPPGLTVTQDISLGVDQHATADGTGHWAIKVGLNEGDNKLIFRIGDDHSTQQTIQVTYTPMQTPFSS